MFSKSAIALKIAVISTCSLANLHCRYRPDRGEKKPPFRARHIERSAGKLAAGGCFSREKPKYVTPSSLFSKCCGSMPRSAPCPNGSGIQIPEIARRRVAAPPDCSSRNFPDPAPWIDLKNFRIFRQRQERLDLQRNPVQRVAVHIDVVDRIGLALFRRAVSHPRIGVIAGDIERDLPRVADLDRRTASAPWSLSRW